VIAAVSLRRAAAAVALAGLLALGCSRRHPAADSAWVGEAARLHALADQLLAAGNRPAARDALAGIVDGPVPAAVPADARRGVRQDTYFRLAQLALDERDARGAVALADRGLALGDGADLFVANLLVVRGAAHEALRDDPAAARDYHRALVINEALLAETLRESGAAPPAPGAQP
jgi:hypothetical protein